MQILPSSVQLTSSVPVQLRTEISLIIQDDNTNCKFQEDNTHW